MLAAPFSTAGMLVVHERHGRHALLVGDQDLGRVSVATRR
jgi:hypothetical protein